jgi:hypothetical protein
VVEGAFAGATIAAAIPLVIAGAGIAASAVGITGAASAANAACGGDFCASEVQGVCGGDCADEVQGVADGAAAEVETLQLAAPKIQCHHIFPQKFRDVMANVGIDIDNFTVGLAEKAHLSGVHGRGGFVVGQDVVSPGYYNRLWEDFFSSNPGATAKEIYQFGGWMMDQFGLSAYPIVPYP